ncbi:hypothetical protein B0A55_10076 [Friedmanniomyces simplex]|uniref:BTB domain-containing protein n=1 Tax=Friedmanniomyces simplex TaxID=329884 RepID=A0A4U0WLK0_9PEZI|nr:hypothetical protein B0A55_10076 [Friedmanniomyces simplex]
MASTPPSSKQDGNQQPAKHFKPSYSGTVTILAGSGKTSFEVHKDIICQSSDFFVAACSKAWAEGKEGTIRLPTVEPDTVKLYIHWIYTDTIDLDILGNDPKLPGNSSLQSTQFTRLYVAADMFLDKAMKNKVMDTILERIDRGDWAPSLNTRSQELRPGHFP